MPEVKWIKLAISFPDDKKIKQLRKLPKGDTIALLWVYLLCLAGETNDGGAIYLTQDIPFTDEMLAEQFGIDIKTVRAGLSAFQKFGMITIDDGIIHLTSWAKHQNIDQLEKYKEQNRNRAAAYRERKKGVTGNAQSNGECNVTVTLPVTQRNAIDKEEDKEEEREEDKDKEIYSGGGDIYAHARDDTPTVENLLKSAVDTLSRECFDRPPTEYEQAKMLACHIGYQMTDGKLQGKAHFDDDRAYLLRKAYEAAANAGKHNIAYVEGCLRNFAERGITTAGEYESYEVSRCAL